LLDIHPAHHAATTWRDFFIHIATIVIGLFIAIGLEQTVELLHRHHQRHQLEEQMREEFQANLQNDDFDFRRLAEFRTYLLDLKSAVGAKRRGEGVSLPASMTEPRRRFLLKVPSMAAWEAAKDNATIAVLPSEKIRIYNRIDFHHRYILGKANTLADSIFAWQSFEERFGDSSATLEVGDKIAPPDLAAMGPADLAEYEKLLAQVIKAVDNVTARLVFFDRENRVVLEGVHSEQEMMVRAIGERVSEIDSTPTNPDPH
jgi:hypothetical protein